MEEVGGWSRGKAMGHFFMAKLITGSLLEQNLKSLQWMSRQGQCAVSV